MSRLESQKRMQYYPTPPRVTALIRERLEFSRPFAALDPCAGEGDALRDLTEGTRATTYGIEPDRDRYLAARGRLDNVLNCTQSESRVSRRAFSLILLNPPYDDEHLTEQEQQATGRKTARKERIFLTASLEHLAPGGVLVYIVPARLLDTNTRAYLSAKLDNLELWHFPEPERERFGQAVAIGTRSDGTRARNLEIEIQDAPPTGARHRVPESRRDLDIWRSSRLNPLDLCEHSRTSSLWSGIAPNPPQAIGEKRPPMDLHAGHLSMLLAAGCIDGVLGSGPDRHLVRGKTAKSVKRTTETTENHETRSVTTTTRHRDKYTVALRILTPQGEIMELV